MGPVATPVQENEDRAVENVGSTSAGRLNTEEYKSCITEGTLEGRYDAVDGCNAAWWCGILARHWRRGYENDLTSALCWFARIRYSTWSLEPTINQLLWKWSSVCIFIKIALARVLYGPAQAPSSVLGLSISFEQDEAPWHIWSGERAGFLSIIFT